jgi:hypothetical protein
LPTNNKAVVAMAIETLTIFNMLGFLDILCLFATAVAL